MRNMIDLLGALIGGGLALYGAILQAIFWINRGGPQTSSLSQWAEKELWIGVGFIAVGVIILKITERIKDFVEPPE